MIITIDGSVGTGKSIVAKKLATKLGFAFFDTGAMYRCFTYGVIKHNIDINDKQSLLDFLNTFDFEIKLIDHEKHYFFEKEDISDKIRQNLVTSKVSQVSAIKEVREKLVCIQREFGKECDAVFEGRDMGTVVFPKADLKIFLTGRPEIRAKRRYDEFCQKFPHEAKNLTLDQVLQDINKRDIIDSSREVSPLKKAGDAVEIDTSDLVVDQVVEKILNKLA